MMSMVYIDCVRIGELLLALVNASGYLRNFRSPKTPHHNHWMFLLRIVKAHVATFKPERPDQLKSLRPRTPRNHERFQEP